MYHEEAANASEFKLAYRQMRQDVYEVFDIDSNSFFIVEPQYPDNEQHEVKDWSVVRKTGRGSKNAADWLSFENELVSQRIDEWKANQEGRTIKIEKPWEEACMQSPINMAIRIKKEDGLLMIRLGNRETYSEQLGGTIVSPVNGPFKHYDGWEPMPADHFYANHAFLPYTERFSDQGRLGKAAFTKLKRQPKSSSPKTKSIVETTTITTAGVISQSLAAAISSTNGAEQKKLIETLDRLAKNVSWLLYEGRDEWKGKSND